MKTAASFWSILFLFTLMSCKSVTSTTDNMKLVEGTWVGQLDADSLVLTFIEGEFEGSPTLSGSAFIPSRTTPSTYIIMNGSRDRQDKIYFALYKYPVVAKEEFHLQGTVAYGEIKGTFTRFDESGGISKTGNWSAKTWYQ